MRRIILSLLLLLPFLVFFVLPISFNLCLPEGCFYNPQNQVCQDGGCANEDVITHLQERPVFTATPSNNILSLLGILILSFLLFLLPNNKTQLLEHQRRFRIISKCFSIDHNLLTFLFAKGILHPKIF